MASAVPMNLPRAAAWVRRGADASAALTNGLVGRRKVASIPTNVRALRSEDECTGHLPPEAGTRFRKFRPGSDRTDDGIDM
ncbi:hypothetical protein GCM10022224_021200 [Nonomuraea antimicrobica]|uniref:Uncharacterized protein n=1 Tax=Nonomuraea antimicrobica TaxID=561173 RepID=A0ABP7BFQ9_9ACTN